MKLRASVPMLRQRVPTSDTRRVKPPPKQVDEHYTTPEHRAWRDAVVRRVGGACEWPGCGRIEPRMFADHIIEIRDGGAKFDVENGRCLCGQHHTLKTIQERAKRHGLA